MTDTLRIYESDSLDPYYNIATEKYLFDRVQPGEYILYLWQNQNTVVIGRNQNVWAECRAELLEQEGGKLARRLSGGGAVFHDVGNLNFTFLCRVADYDQTQHHNVIREACHSLGIQVTVSGRNDLLAEGRKFSGNAFYHSQGRSYHHGTLLVSANMEKLSRYLSPPKAKLEAKGVASVRSRVVNLSELAPGLTCKEMAKAMKAAFAQVYKLPASDISLSPQDCTAIREMARDFESPQWLFGKQPPCSLQCQEYFSWGHIQLKLDIQAGNISSAAVFSDTMDWTLPPRLETLLTGLPFRLDAIEDALAPLPETIARDLVSLLRQQL